MSNLADVWLEVRGTGLLQGEDGMGIVCVRRLHALDLPYYYIMHAHTTGSMGPNTHAVPLCQLQPTCLSKASHAGLSPPTPLGYTLVLCLGDCPGRALPPADTHTDTNTNTCTHTHTHRCTVQGKPDSLQMGIVAQCLIVAHLCQTFRPGTLGRPC